MHFVKVKGILSNKNGINLYRGCSHGCIYCDSRSKCYQMNHDFEDIEVKINAPELLESALYRKRKKCMIATGAMCDPYLHIEKELKLTRSCLEIIDKYEFGVAILTKSDLILRDIDLIEKINQTSKAIVQMTITTYDDALCSILEPNVCSTSSRLNVLHICKEKGIPTIVWLCPILPFINDTKYNIEQIVKACARENVKGIINFGMGLTLREGNREYFYEKLDKLFPGLKEVYIKKYGNAYELPVQRANELYHLFVSLCQQYGIEYRMDEIFKYLNKFEAKKQIEQLTLF
ncbi:SPL family radical SAM protein [Floccifex sp.]|uniref:SPL family radical SAM protein n=1 Tax=Floccifex sp. TaxID=2815810 RepID=UPI003F10300E